MSLKTRIILVVVIGLIMGCSLSIGGKLFDSDQLNPKQNSTWKHAQAFTEAIENIQREYIEPIDESILLENAIRGMVSNLDPHSEFLDESEHHNIRTSTSGSYVGIGIEVGQNNNRIQIISPIAGSPAARAGIRSGDELVGIDGQALEHNNLSRTIELLRGQVGSKVKLSISRDDDVIDYYIQRQVIRVASVHKNLLNTSYGYVRVSQFTGNTAYELNVAIDDLKNANQGSLKGLILDLRNNPGGILDSAVKVSDLFLDTGIIVSANGRTPESRFIRSAHSGDIIKGSKIVVLVNNGSASASEIVAGALQDNNRGIIVGTSTFGKGLVQTVVPLSKGQAIKLTTSRYFTPSGDSIHEVGIRPDIYIDNTHGFPDLSLSGSLDIKADKQLAGAISFLNSQMELHSQLK